MLCAGGEGGPLPRAVGGAVPEWGSVGDLAGNLLSPRDRIGGPPQTFKRGNRLKEARLIIRCVPNEESHPHPQLTHRPKPIVVVREPVDN